MAISKLPTGAILDNSITNAKIADDAIGVADLAATGTPSTTTFLRGDNAWAVPIGGVTSVNGVTGAITAAHIATAVEAASGSNTFTDADHTKLSNIEGSATADQTNSEIKTAVEAATSIALGGSPTTTTQAESDNTTKLATTAYVTAKITTLIGGAPSTLNDLNELALAINDDNNYNSTLTTALATKMPKSGGAFTGAVTTNSTIDGRDVAADGVTADAALPKAGGTMTGALNIQSADNALAFFKSTDANANIKFSDSNSSDINQVGVGAIGNNLTLIAGGDNRMTIDNSGNVGIGVVPETVHSQLTTLQLGETGMLAGGDTAWGGILEIGSNYYRDSGGFKRTTADKVCLTEYNNGDGNIVFKNAVTGAADSAVTLRNQLTIGDDGKISTWQGTGMTSHFNVGNRDIDVGTSTGFDNRQERIGLMAADPWGTAAGIYLSVSRNTNQDGRSHPSLHFTGNHGAGQSEDYLMLTLNSNFYGRETVTVGSSNNDANMEVNGQLSVPKQPSFWASGTVASGNNLQASNVEFVFSNAQSNVGNHYSTSTGRFTAPVAGAYLFSGTVSSNSIGSYRWTIKKNNTQIQAGGGSNDNVPHGLNSRDEASTCTIILQLAANDYVSCSVRSGQTCMLYGGHSYFSGVLVG